MIHYVINKNISQLGIVLMISIFLGSISYAQEENKTRYKKNFGKNNHYLTVGLQYKYNPIGESFGSEGFVFNAGINLAKFYSANYILGLSFDLKPFGYFNSLREPSNKFISSFNSSINTIFQSELDSNNTQIVKNSINYSGQNTADNLFNNSLILNYGIMFSPFPNQYGGVIIKIKTGYRHINIDNVFGNKFVNNGISEKFPLRINKTWIYEVTVKPLSFFRNTYFHNDNYSQVEKLVNSFVITLFYERLNLENAEFNSTNFTQMVSEQFISKYGVDQRFGFKIGFSLY